MIKCSLDYATHSVKELSDMALFIPKSDDAAQRAEEGAGYG
ncbi:hypothetical protein [Paenibacillus sp. BAC0078]